MSQSATMSTNQLLLCLVLLLMVGWPAAQANHSNGKAQYSGYTVHLVFSNHLDVGFTDLDNNVINLYFHQHYQAAINLAKQLQDSLDNPHGDRFRYMTHSWLLSLFFDCPPGLGVSCPNASEIEAVKSAIQDGVIHWHAAPFNPQYELFDADLLAAALDLTHRLDARFGLAHKKMVSLRDVPGLTRAAIPVLASRGVQGFTGGVNGFSAPPGVPKNTPFVWRDEESDTELLAMWHPGGYAGYHNETQVDYHEDCVLAEGFKHVLCASWGSDNFGPPASLEELQRMFRIVRDQWPGARVVASSLDEYLEHLTAAVSKGLKLPVVTGEIGDTWIHGVASDPGRMADYRAALRAHHTCLADPKCDSESAAFLNFTRLLVKVPEHTWGISFNAYFGDFSNYTNAWLHQLLSAGEQAHHGLAVSVESWRRQRRYTDWALEALPQRHPIREAVSADREARQHAHRRLVPLQLVAEGAVPLLPEPQVAAADAAHRQGLPAASLGDWRVLTNGAGQGALPEAGDSNSLLFCSKYWLIEVDRNTGGLLRLQRLYGTGTNRTAGNDWAAASPSPTQAAAATPDPAAATSVTKRRLLLAQQKPSKRIHPSANAEQLNVHSHWQQQQQQQQHDADHSQPAVKGSKPRQPLAAFAQLQYNVYNLDDYNPVWDHYAYMHPVWVGDFGKYNMSASSNLSAMAQAELVQVYHLQNTQHGLMLHLKLRFPSQLVDQAGAPETAWLVIHSPPDSQQLHLTVAWQNKTVTRLPEAMWLKFTPGEGAVDEGSWRMRKLNSHIDPKEIIRNGSHSLHAVSHGVSVASKDGTEQLHIHTVDVPLVNVGKPNPFPNPCDGPDMSHGVSYNIINTIWGTNYAMWLYTPEDANMAFRFVLDAAQADRRATS